MDSSDSPTYVELGGEGATGRLIKLRITREGVSLPVSEFFKILQGHSLSPFAFRSEKHLTANNYRVCFTDGACLDNGQSDSRAGIGGTLGSEAHQWAIPIDHSIDPGGKRSSQRAELLAAIEGLRRLSIEGLRRLSEHGVTPRPHPGQGGNPDSCWIIATDSEYVCNGITEWVYTWKVREPSSLVNNDFKYAPYLIQENNWLTRSGTKPSNLDLFLRLHDDILSYERDQNIRIGFLKVDRTDNQIADGLAKKAANLARQV